MKLLFQTLALLLFSFTFQVKAIEFTTAGKALEEFRSLRPDNENYPNFYRLTPNGYNQSGALWVKNPVDLDEPFLIEFIVNFGDFDAEGADGIALVFHKDSDLKKLIGGGGEGMGYQGIENSLALEFDTFENTAPGYTNRDDIPEDHFDIRRNGEIHFDQNNGITPKEKLVDKCGNHINVENGKKITIQVIWIPGDPNIDVSIGTLKVFFNCFDLYSNTSFDFDLDLGWTDLNDIYFGLTAATGNRRNFHRVKITEPVLTVSSTPLCRNIQLSADFPSFCGSVNYKWTASDGTQNGLINPNSKNPIATISDTYTCEVDFSNTDFDILNNSIQTASITIQTLDVIPKYSFMRQIGNSFRFGSNILETDDAICGAQLSNDCGYLITATSGFHSDFNSSNGGGSWLIRTDFKGNIIWNNLFISTVTQVDLNNLTQHQKDNYIFWTNIHNSIDSYKWQTEDDGTCNNTNKTMIRKSDGFFLTGEMKRIRSRDENEVLPEAGFNNILLAKIDNNGKVKGTKIIDFSGGEVGFQTYQQEDDRYITYGATYQKSLFLGLETSDISDTETDIIVQKKFELNFVGGTSSVMRDARFASFPYSTTNGISDNYRHIYATSAQGDLLVVLLDDIFASNSNNIILKQAIYDQSNNNTAKRVLISKKDPRIFYIVDKEIISKFELNVDLDDFDLLKTYKIDYTNGLFNYGKLKECVLNETDNSINFTLGGSAHDLIVLNFNLITEQLEVKSYTKDNSFFFDNLNQFEGGIGLVGRIEEDLELISHRFDDLSCPVDDIISVDAVPNAIKVVDDIIYVTDATIIEKDSYKHEFLTYPIDKDYNCLNVDECDCSELDENSFMLYSEAMPRTEYDDDCCFEIFIKNAGNCALTNFDLNITQSVNDLVTDLNPTQSFQLLQVNDAISIGTICLPYGEESVDIEVGIKKNNLSCTNDIDEVISLSTVVGCFESCCDLIDVNFRIGNSGNTDYCYWFPNVTTTDETACNINQVEVDVYYNDELVEPNASGFIGLFDNTGTKKIAFDIKYVVKINGVICREQYTTLVCLGCDCPPTSETSKWLEVTSDQYDAACPGNECLVTANLTIPHEYKDCYKDFKINYKIKDKDGVELEEETGIPYYSPFDYSKCINAGENIQFEIEMSSGPPGLELPCVIYSDPYTCQPIEMIERPNPCDLGENVAWSDPDQETVIINGCTYVVTFHYRKAGGMQDVQMTMVSRLGPCTNPIADEEVFKKALPSVIAKIIRGNALYDPQDNASIKCVSYWRVVQNSCWAKYWGYTDADYWEVLVPCYSDCCARQLKVCNDGTNVTVTDVGFVFGSSTFDCSYQSVPTGTIPSNASNYPSCEDLNCDVYMNINEIATRGEDYNSDLYLTEPASKSFNMDLLNNPEALMVYQFTNSNEKLEILVVRTIQESITIELFDLSGKLVGSKKFPNLQSGNKLIIDISQLPSGSYIFNFVGNGRIYSTNIFQIIK